MEGRELIFEEPETVWWLDLTDPDPLTLRQIYAIAVNKQISVPLSFLRFLGSTPERWA